MKLKITFRRNTKPATERMMVFAERISETLDIPMPKDEGFDTIHEFIDKHAKEFQDARRHLEADLNWFLNTWPEAEDFDFDDHVPF